MMKLLSNISKVSASLGFSLALVTLPLTALAVGSPAPVAHGFCANLAQDESKVATGMNERAAKLAQGRANAGTKLQNMRTQVDAKVTSDRASWDATRLQHFAKLEAKATMPSAKAAVTAFEQAVLGAVATRRAAVDQARTTFRLAEDKLIASRHGQIDGAATTFKSAVASAQAQAQSSCNAGALPTTVRITFVNAMKQARTVYQSNVVGIIKIDPAVQALAQTRKAAIQTADGAFNAAVHAAATVLKTALHQ